MKKVRFFLSVLLAMILVLGMIPAVSAASEPVLTVTPSVESIDVGAGTANITYTITLNPNGNKVAAIQFELSAPEGMTLGTGFGVGYQLNYALYQKFSTMAYEESTGRFGASGGREGNTLDEEATILTINATVDISAAKTYTLGVSGFLCGGVGSVNQGGTVNVTDVEVVGKEPDVVSEPVLTVTPSVESIDVGAGTANITYTITLNPNGNKVAAIQFELSAPEGMTLGTGFGVGYQLNYALYQKFSTMAYEESTGRFGASGGREGNTLDEEATILTINATVDISAAKTYTLGVSGFLCGGVGSVNQGGTVDVTDVKVVGPVTHTVTFMNGTQKVDEVSVTSGSTVSKPADPTDLMGRIFDGWYLNDAEYDFDTPVTEDITLYAKWTDVEVGKKVITAPTADSTVFTYTGSEQTYTLATSADYTISGNVQTNAGSYTITVALKDTANTKWADDTTDAKTYTFTIGKKAVAEPIVSGTYTYTGEEQTVVLNGLESFMTVASGDKATNVGDYSVTITLDANHKWDNGADGVIGWSIAKATPDVTAPTAKDDLAYTGAAQALINAGSTTGGTMQYSLDNDTWSTEIPTATNADTYTVYYKVVGDGNYSDVAAQSITVTVGQAEVSEPTVIGTYTYTGEEQTVVLDGVESYMTVASGDKATNVGYYNVIITLDANHKWGANSDGVIGWSIAKATPDVTAPTAKDDLAYTGAAQALINAGSTTGGTMQYSLDNDTWSTEIPTATNAGTYTVYYKVVGDGNYNDVAAQSIIVTIGQKVITAPTADSTVFTYTGSEQTYTLATSADYTISGNVQTNAGSYTITVALEDTANTKWADDTTDAKTYTFTIGKATQTISGENITITIDKTKNLDEHFGAQGTLSYEIVGENTTGSAVAGNTLTAGTTPGTFQLKVSATATNNYDAAEKIVTVTVTAKATQSNFGFYDGDTKVSEQTKTYGDAEFTLAASKSSVANPEITYSSSDPSVATVDATGKVTILKAGTTTITASVNGDADYETATASYELAVGQLAVAEPIVSGTYTYTGSEQTVVLSGLESFMTVVSGDKATNAGDYTVTITLDANHKWDANSDGVIAWSIGKKVITAPTADSTVFTYTGSEQTYTLATSADYTISGNVQTNAGSYTITVALKDTANTKWADDTTDAKTYTFTIGKATPVVTAPTAKTLTANNSAQALINAGSTTGGTMQYSLDNDTWSFEIPTATAAGRYTVYYKVVGDSNYNDVAAQSVAVTISSVYVPPYIPPTPPTPPSPPTPPVVEDDECKGDSTCPMYVYTDLDMNDWYHDAVHYCIEEGLMIGTGTNIFEPNTTVTRAMMVQLLYNLEGRPAYTAESNFSDVFDGYWYEDAIHWAAQKGFVKGYPEGDFRPNQTITRQEMATLLWRYAGSKESKHDLSAFSDADDIAGYARTAMAWANENGIINGMGNNILNPSGDTPRVQLAQLMFNYLTK